MSKACADPPIFHRLPLLLEVESDSLCVGVWDGVARLVHSMILYPLGSMAGA